jgi:hypothetical protein
MKYNIFAAFILSCSLAFCGPIQLLVKSSPAALDVTNTVSLVLGAGGEITEIVIHDCPTNTAATVSVSASYAEGNMLRGLTTVSIDATNTVGYASVTNGLLPQGSTVYLVGDQTNRPFKATLIVQ